MQPLAAPVRARVLARARAAMIAGRTTDGAGRAGRTRARWGVPFAAASAASIAIGTTGYEIGVHQRPGAAGTVTPSIGHVMTTVGIEAPTTAAAPVATTTAGAPVNPASRAALGPPAPDELRLLQLARVAVARRDFAAALAPIAQHARWFAQGRLAEEREALRVTALSGLGRLEDARRAAHAFESRFPRSVLLPSVETAPRR
jgi:hypothetical protein